MSTPPADADELFVELGRRAASVAREMATSAIGSVIAETMSAPTATDEIPCSASRLVEFDIPSDASGDL